MTIRRFLLFFAAAFSVWHSLPATPAWSQTTEVARELKIIRRQIAALQEAVYNPPPSDTNTAAQNQQILRRLDNLEQLLVENTARYEALSRNLQQLEQRLQQPLQGGSAAGFRDDQGLLSAGDSSRTTQSNTAVTAATPATTAGVTADSPDTGAPAATTPKQVYQLGHEHLRSGDYTAAESAFARFISAFPEDELQENAHYWRAEAVYAQQDFTRAASLFLDTYNLDKKGRKASDALLKLAMSLFAIEKPEAGCKTLEQLLADDTISGQLKRRASGLRTAQNCPADGSQ